MKILKKRFCKIGGFMKKSFVGIVTFIVALSMIFNFVGCDQQANPVQPSDPKPIGFKITLPSANPERAGYYTQDDASLYRVELEKDERNRRQRPSLKAFIC